ARDGDRLALSAGQPEHRALDILEVRVEPPDDLAGRGLHRRVVERAATRELAAEEDVRRRVEVVRERKRLIDGLDPERLRIARIADRDRLAADEDLTRVGRTRAGECSHQGRLSRAVPTDDADDLAGMKIDGHAVDRADAAERDPDVAQLDQRYALRGDRRRLRVLG